MGELLGMLDETAKALLIFLLIPFLLNCFFGYKIQKLLITLTGVLIGLLIGLLFGLESGEVAVAVLAALLLALIGGFVAFKLYRVGIFFTFWFYGTLFFGAIFLILDGIDSVPFGLLPGLVVGILALVLHKGFVICSTAICGGVPAGFVLGAMTGSDAVGILLGLALPVLGILVQFRMEKTAPAAASVGQPAAPGQWTPPNAAAAGQPGASAAPAVPENRFQSLGTTVPSTYYPRGGVLVEEYSLFKDGGENVYASVNFRNVGTKPVIAVYYTLLCRSVGGDELENTERVLLDLNVAPGASFSSGEPFPLADRTTRGAEVRLTQVVTEGGESVRLTEEDVRPLPQPRELRESLSAELLELSGVGGDERYFLTELENGLWTCACGTIAGETCPRCGRTRGSVLRDNGSDIYTRASDCVHAELSRAEGLSGKRELTMARDVISRKRALLAGFENLSGLGAECDGALASIDGRLSEITLREEKAKKRARRFALLGGAAAVCVVAAVLTVRHVRGLEPSERRVRRDASAEFSERYGNYRVTDSEIGSGSNFNWDYKTGETWREENGLHYYFELWGREKTLRDELYVKGRIHYEKVGGAYRPDEIDFYSETITPAEKPSPSDEYTDLLVCFDLGGEHIYISDHGDSWEVDSDGVDRSEVSYSREPDYGGAEVREDLGVVPTVFRFSYGDAEGEVSRDIRYGYQGGRVWEGGLVELKIPAKAGVELTDESLAALLRGETMRYENDEISCAYLTLSRAYPRYEKGYRRASVTADFVWDDGQGAFDGKLEMQLERSADKWRVTSVSYPKANSPKPHAALSETAAAELLRTALAGEAVELTVDGVQESGGTAEITGYCTVREGEYLRSARVEAGFKYHPGQGYLPEGEPVYSDGRLRPEQDISASLSTHYRLSTSGTTPVGVAGSGSAQAGVHINTSGGADITLNIGGLRVNLAGTMNGAEPTLSCSSASQRIKVRYTLFFTTEAEISYTARGSLRYEDGTLSGTLNFSTTAWGVDNFSVVLGE